MMLNWSRAFLLLLVGYAIASIIGYGANFLHPVYGLFGASVVNLALFAYLAHRYLFDTSCSVEDSTRVMLRLITFWFAITYAIDILVFIVFMPILQRTSPDWMFALIAPVFYLFMFLAGYIGRWFYVRRERGQSLA